MVHRAGGRGTGAWARGSDFLYLSDIIISSAQRTTFLYIISLYPISFFSPFTAMPSSWRARKAYRRGILNAYMPRHTRCSTCVDSLMLIIFMPFDRAVDLPLVVHLLLLFFSVHATGKSSAPRIEKHSETAEAVLTMAWLVVNRRTSIGPGAVDAVGT